MPILALFCVPLSFLLHKSLLAKMEDTRIPVDEPKPLISFETEAHLERTRDHGYYGYEPVCAADFPFEDDDFNSSTTIEETPINELLLCDNARTSKTLLIFSIVFAINFIAMLVWLILIAKCHVTNLCDTIDRSSLATVYAFQNFSFRVPSVLVWIALTCGTLGLLLSTLFSFTVLKKSVGTARMVEVATIIRKGSTLFLVHQNASIVIPILVAVVFIGLAVNWDTAGSFSFGAIICVTTSHAGMSMATRGNIRASAAAFKGVSQAVKVAFRTGASAGLLIMSTALIGISAVYLMFGDVRALAGFAAGASTTALFLRTSGSLFAKSSGKSGSIVQNRGSKKRDDPRSPPGVAAYMGSGIGTMFGLGPDLFESFVGALVATAILGSNLPYFYRDSYAMCIFNHLEIDQTCGPFGYPEALSYAVYICRRNTFYVSYPHLTTWASNAAFVALPFLIGAAGMVISVVSTAYIKVPSFDEKETPAKQDVVQKLRVGIRLNMIVGSLLLIAATAGICFGLFGPSSKFQKTLGLGRKRNLVRMELNSNTDRCVILSVTDSSSTEQVLVPKGGFHTTTYYRPVDANGFQLGSAHTTAIRLFGCCLLGVLLVVLMTGFTSFYFTSEAFGPSQRLSESAEMGLSQMLMRGFANGLMSTVPATIFVVIVIISSYSIYGAYGVGLTAVTCVSFLPIVATSSVLASVCENARGITRMSTKKRRSTKTTKMLSMFSGVVRSTAEEFSNGAMFLSAISVLLAAQQISGLVPSARQLVGTAETIPIRLIGSAKHVSLSSISVIASLLSGIGIAFLVTGLLLLSIRRVTKRMSYSLLQESERRYATFILAGIRTSLLETIGPYVITIAIPILVGFGLGKQSLIAYNIGMIVISFLLSSFCKCLGGSLESAERQITTRGNETHWNALYAKETGITVRECMSILGSVAKSSASVTLVMIALIPDPPTRQWIPLIVLLLLGAMFAVFSTWKHGKHKGLAEMLAKASKKKGSATKKVSPFYVNGVTIDTKTCLPGSAMREVIDTLGGDGHISLDLIPISDRTEAEFENAQVLAAGERRDMQGGGFIEVDEIRKEKE